MSGPIVRKYGFPNFENIFGKRELEHGVDEESPPVESTESKVEATKDAPAKGKPRASRKKK
jgi:hypothetical protein